MTDNFTTHTAHAIANSVNGPTHDASDDTADLTITQRSGQHRITRLRCILGSEPDSLWISTAACGRVSRKTTSIENRNIAESNNGSLDRNRQRHTSLTYHNGQGRVKISIHRQLVKIVCISAQRNGSIDT